MDDVHVDYKEIMDKKEEITFSDIYEKAICNIETTFNLNKEVIEELKKKRDFGVKKYGEYSFQLNMKNALTVPTIKHLKEEIIDSFNYCLHEYYKRNLLGDETYQNKLSQIMACLKMIWNITDTIK